MMEGVPVEATDLILLKRILFTLVGLMSCFLGLWIYKSTVKAVGFLVGFAAGGYLSFVLFTQFKLVVDLEHLHYLILIVLIPILCGVLGMYLMKMFQYVIFFLAGGIIGLILARLWGGEVRILDFSTFESFGNALTKAPPTNWEIVIFIAGGLLYMINIGPIVALSTAALGAFVLRWTWQDLLLDLGPNVADIMAFVLIVVGAAVQLAAFRGRMDILPGRFRR